MIDGYNRVLDYIERHLDDDIEIDELAKVAVTSTYHLRRMFSSLAGMPLSSYIRRRRMTVAAAAVRNDAVGLLQIAIRYGYGSAEAFGRAFREVHGITPSKARADNVDLVTQPRLRFRLTVEGATAMRHRIIEKPAFTIAGRKVTVPLIYEGVNPHIAEFIESLTDQDHARINDLSDQEPGGILAVTFPREPTPQEGDDIDYYHATVTSSVVPDDFDVLEVPAATWAVFEVDGEFPAALQQMCADTAAVWFPSNPYRSVHAPELLKVEYSDDQTTARAELWTMVEPES